MPIGQLDYEKKKAPSGDYAHYYGDIKLVRTLRTSLDILLEKHHSLNDYPRFLIGKFENVRCPVVIDPNTNREEIHDIYDIVFISEENANLTNEQILEEIVKGSTMKIGYKNLEKTKNIWKNTIFQKWINATIYKFETHKGFPLIFTQQDVDTLNEHEKIRLGI